MVRKTKHSAAYLAVAAEIIALLYSLSFGAFGDGNATGFKPDCARNITITNSVDGNDSRECLNGVGSCATLNYAFTECYILNNSTFRVGEGHHELTGDLGTVYNSTLSRLSDLTISGEGSDRTTISGLGRYGFAFVNITGLILSGIEFKNCSQSRPSTSFGEGKPFKSEPFHVGIYVWRCTNVLIQDIIVGESQSVGLVVYETRGTVAISDSIFHDNIIELKEGSNSPGGGGVNIEFPYCPPGHFNDRECGENNDFNSYSNYTIHNCTFRGNIAHTIVDSASQFILPNRSYHQSFGRGGGMAVYFSGNASNITMTISQCQFSKNHAIYGAGLFAEFHDKAQNNQLSITDNSFTFNECYNFDKSQGAGGGGMRIAFVFYIEPMSVMNNTVTMDNNYFEGNRAYFGGGLSFLSGLEQQTVDATNKVTIRNSVWRENTARLGSAAYFSGFNQVRIGLPPIVEFESNTLENNSINYDANASHYIAGSGTVYCYNMPIRLGGSNIFTHNIGTGMVVVGVGIQILEDSTTEFVGNLASDGGGMAFYANGWVTLHPNTSMEFRNNSVTGKGGALYAETTGAHGILASRDCFIRYSQWWVEAEKWNCTISFDNNHAHGEGSNIYISSVYLCIWGGSYGKANTSLEIRKTVFHWSPFKYSENETGSIASGISDVEWEGPKNSSEFSVSIVPGQLYDFSHNIILYNDYNESATAPLLASVVPDSHDGDNEQGIVIPSDSSFTVNTLRLYVRGKGQQNGKIKLQSVNDPPMTFFLNVITLPCPPGAWLMPPKVNTSVNVNECKCTSPGSKGHLIGVTCIRGDRDIVTQRTLGYWVGFDKHRDLPVTASCPQYFCNDAKEKFGRIQLEGNDFSKYMCANNREGEICGKCTKGTSIVATSISFRCEECHSDSSSGVAWVKWFALELSLATVVVGLILVLDINVACGLFCSFVFFSQIMLSLNIQLCQCIGSDLEKDPFHVFQLLYSFWSLRLSYIIPNALDVCLPGFDNAIYPLAVGYIFAFYPFFLIFVVWLIARCHKHKFQMCCNDSQRCCKRARELVDNCFNFLSQRISVTNGIATCLVITYSKLTHISLFILAPVSINTPYHVNATSDSPSILVWYNGNWAYFSTPHLYFGLGAIPVLLVFVIFPPLFLLSYPALPDLVLKCNKKWGERLHNFYSKDAIHHLLDIFQGHYKEKCKFFAGMWFLYRLFLDANNIFNQSIWSLFAVQVILGTLFLLLHAAIQPYEEKWYNIVDFCFFANIILLSALASLASQTEDVNNEGFRVLILILLSLPYAFFIIVGCKKVYNRIKSYCHGKKRGTDREPFVQPGDQHEGEVRDDVDNGGEQWERPEFFYSGEHPRPSQELPRI